MDSSYKTCKACGKIKIFTDFQVYSKYKDKIEDPKYYNKTCRKCHTLKTNKWQKENPKKVALSHRKKFFKHKYNISLQQYDEMVEKQENKCLICSKNPDQTSRTINKILHVDHCHKTGKVRGLLCFSCNTALGFLNDDTALFEKCIDYLKKNL